MLKKLKENKKIVIIVIVALGAVLAWWQSRDAKEPTIEKPEIETVVKE
tara:strand:- start:228 stop:371 length:144 start_codon:yes stop_codon:yes gene_type:complete